jgi:tripartite-type tricarboxylate transporter receptor subunit TctC
MHGFAGLSVRGVAGTLATLAAFGAFAQPYPTKPVRLILGFSTGGSTDTGSRLLAQSLTQQFGQTVVVENRTGAGGAIANEMVAKAPPDGYTLLMLSASATILPALRKLAYDVVRDYAPVSLVADGPLVLVVHASVPVRTVKELIGLARAKPDVLTYGSNGRGSTAHMSGELFNSLAGTRLLHVPYKGSAEAATATAAGEIDINFPSIPPSMALISTGRLRALAVTSAKRASLIPAVPTISESGLPGYAYGTWFGVVAPARTPADIVTRLHGAISTAMQSAELRDSFTRQGLEPQVTTPEAFGAYIRREVEQNAALILKSGVKGE